MSWLNRLDRLESRLLLRGPRLEGDEAVDWCLSANHVQNGRRAVGGQLCVTNRRMVFVENRMETPVGGREWSCSLRDVLDCAIEPRGRNPYAGAWRRRLRLDIVGDTFELFVVSDPESVVDRLKKYINLDNT